MENSRVPELGKVRGYTFSPPSVTNNPALARQTPCPCPFQIMRLIYRPSIWPSGGQRSHVLTGR